MPARKPSRREFILVSSASLAATHLSASLPVATGWQAQWIWYPGQLAAYRHARRVKLAVRRCAYLGYPGNFRQPVTETWFRKIGAADRNIPLRWAGPVARIRATIGGRGGDITNWHSILGAGQSNIEVQIDFAQSLPCLLLEGAEFSTGPTWEASLDGQHWVLAETSPAGDPAQLPDAECELTVTFPVARVMQPAAAPRESYTLASGNDLLVDFDESELGSLRFSASGRGQLTVQVGESIAEVRDPDATAMEQYPLAPIALTADPQEIVLPQRALRFVRFASSGDTQLSNVRFDARVWPARELGHFESGDADLNSIWTAAVATLRSNMHDFYLDGVRRDALLWHDGPLNLDAYERVFFDAELSRQTLIAETMPERPSVRDVGILDSGMYDVLGFERELLVRGDPAFSQMFRDRIEDILDFYHSLQDSRGFVNAANVQPYGFFPDWSASVQSGPDVHGTPAYAQMLLAATSSAAARLAQGWGDNAASEKYRASAAQLRQSIRENFWNQQEGLYANGFDSAGKLDARFTSFAQAFAIACDIAQPDEYASLFAFLDDSTRRPQHFSLSQVVELTAYGKAGRAAQAVQRLKSGWLPMLRAGYHRFFEDIDATKSPNEQLSMYGRKYAASLCHAWAGAAPVMALSRGVLGVEPLEPGYALCSVAPQRCGLAWVHGAVPTPHGPIQIEWTANIARVTLPQNVTARLANNTELRGPGTFAVSAPR
jgi:hypothetical protein